MSATRRPARLLRELAAELQRPGESDISGADLWLIGRTVVTAVIVVTNGVGALAVTLVALFVVPEPTNVTSVSSLRLTNTLLAVTFFLAALLVGVWIGTRGVRRLRGWVLSERPASWHEIRRVLRAPMYLFVLQVSLWLIGALIFGLYDGLHSAALGLRISVLVAAGGLVTASCAYLLTELALRPAAARALERGAPRRLIVPGVATRLVLAWVLGTATQLFGIVAIGLLGLNHGSSLRTHPRTGVQQLATAMVVLGGLGLVVGLLVVTIVARTTAGPLDSVRRALRRVRQGEFGERVAVYDGTQIGLLQLGFNQMTEGLAERERIRKAFGTYVDPEVAERILEEGTNLSGEEVEVSIMFIDIRDFTGFAESREPEAVVSALNKLFEQMVAIVQAEEGRVDKFVGDGLLAVFGAPRRLGDHADRALAAAVRIAREVKSPHGLAYGIGINSGRVLAGNVGGAGRLEFSVIGDAVNVAARVEAATRTTGDQILVTDCTCELLSDGAPELAERTDVKLKGKRDEVRLFAVAPPAEASRSEGREAGAARATSRVARQAASTPERPPS